MKLANCLGSGGERHGKVATEKDSKPCGEEHQDCQYIPKQRDTVGLRGRRSAAGGCRTAAEKNGLSLLGETLRLV
ncbi:MAG: hypothetical protein EBS01_02475 [Verrucomicrobia bacterium]|nr:hypothetical protein [Verrucomicrobiota bacterium]